MQRRGGKVIGGVEQGDGIGCRRRGKVGPHHRAGYPPRLADSGNRPQQAATGRNRPQQAATGRNRPQQAERTGEAYSGVMRKCSRHLSLAQGAAQLCVTTCPDCWMSYLGRGNPSVATTATLARNYVSNGNVNSLTVSDGRDDTGFHNVAWDKSLESTWVSNGGSCIPTACSFRLMAAPP